MTTLAEIRDALGARLQTLGLTEATTMSQGQLTPYFVAMLGNVDYHATHSVTTGPWASGEGEPVLVFEVVIFVGNELIAEAERQLSEFAENSGGRSVRACIEDEPTLGITGVHATVMSSRGSTAEEVDSMGRLGRPFTIHIAAPKG